MLHIGINCVPKFQLLGESKEQDVEEMMQFIGEMVFMYTKNYLAKRF